MFLSTCTLDLHTDYMYKLAILWVTYSVVTSVISYSSLGPVHVNQNRADQRRSPGSQFLDKPGLTVVCHEVRTVYSIWKAFLFTTSLQNRRTLLCNLGEQK